MHFIGLVYPRESALQSVRICACRANCQAAIRPRLERHVKEIGWRDLSRSNSPRLLPVHPARESDFSALKVNGEDDSMRDVIAEESDSPATQGGRGLIARGRLASSCQSSSPAARGGRGRPVAPIPSKSK